MIYHIKQYLGCGVNASQGQRHPNGLLVRSMAVVLVAAVVTSGSLSAKPTYAQAEHEQVETQLYMPQLAMTAADELIGGQTDGEPVDDGLVEEEEPNIDEELVGDTAEWKADMETGDFSQWIVGNPTSGIIEDSGRCIRPQTGLSKEQAHSGSYSIKMTIDSRDDAGCRQFRKAEPASGEPLYYSAWYYIPKQVQIGTFWNIMQFKSKLNKTSNLFWKIDVRNDSDGQMYAVLVWKGPMDGPHAGDGTDVKQYAQTIVPLPVGKWFNLEVYLEQSEQFDGRITVWQDGVQLFDIENVRTRHPGGHQNFSVNHYGRGLTPNPSTLFIDDVSISTTRTNP